MIAPGFESHQCLAGMWKRWLSCHAGHQEVDRCCTRGESQGMCNVTRTPPLSSNKAEPTLALKPGGDVITSLKQGYQWPHKKDSCPPKFKKKNNKKLKANTIFKLITLNFRANCSSTGCPSVKSVANQHHATSDVFIGRSSRSAVIW